MSGPPVPDAGWADLELSPDPIVVVDADEVVVCANALAVRLLAAGADLAGCKAADVLRLRDATGRDWWRCVGAARGRRAPARPPA